MSWLARILKRPVNRVTIHHQGGGKPQNVDLSKHGYTASVYPGGFTIYRTPWQSWATRTKNHISYDIVLTGNRNTWEVTDEDIANIAAIVHQGQDRKEIAAMFGLFPHGTLHPPPLGYPSGTDPTECPGIETIAEWPAIDSAVHAAPLVAPQEEPMLFPSKTQTDPNRFRGAQVDLAKKRIGLLNAAECDPVPVINNPNAWIGSFPGPAPFSFTVVTADTNEYHFLLP